MNLPRCLTLVLGFACVPCILEAQDAIRFLGADPATGSSKAVLVSNRALLHTDQLLPAAGGSPEQQAEALLRAMSALLAEAGHGDAVPIRLEWCLRDAAALDAARRAMARAYAGPHQPAATFVVGKLRDPQAALSLNAIAAARPGTVVRQPTILSTTVGKVSLLPPGGVTQVAGQAERGATMKEGAALTLASLLRTLEFLRLTKEDVVQYKIFLQPMDQASQVFDAFREAYGRDEAIPPLVFVEWLGRAPSIEIELVAAATPAAAGGPSRGVAYLTPPGMTQPTVYSRVAAAASPTFIYTSTLVASKPGEGALQARDIFAQLQVLLAACDSSFDHLVKATYYNSNDDGSRGLVELRPSLYPPRRPPAASKAMVAGTGFAERTLSLDMIAVPR